MPFGPGSGMTQSSSNNPHIAEERQMNNVDDSGINEEDKYVPPLPFSSHAPHIPHSPHSPPPPPPSSLLLPPPPPLPLLLKTHKSPPQLYTTQIRRRRPRHKRLHPPRRAQRRTLYRSRSLSVPQAPHQREWEWEGGGAEGVDQCAGRDRGAAASERERGKFEGSVAWACGE